MPKQEWGTKRVCPTTGKRFYDLNADPVVSPYTGEVVELQTMKTRMIMADADDAANPKAKAKNAKADEDGDTNVELDDNLLEEDENDGNVSLEDLADMGSDDEEDS